MERRKWKNDCWGEGGGLSRARQFWVEYDDGKGHGVHQAVRLETGEISGMSMGPYLP